MIIDDSVAADFALLIRENWGKFLAVFAARSDCFGDIRIIAVKELADQAHYDPATATVLIRVPARGSLLRRALVDEWAHHLEFQCAAQVELRPAFLVAQGLPANTPWQLEAGSINMRTYLWAKIPSEQYAETVAAIVLDNPHLRTTAPITAAGIQVIQAWASEK